MAAAERLLRYNLLVSEAMLAQGLGNVGDSRRMQRFLHKLLSGGSETRPSALAWRGLQYAVCSRPPGYPALQRLGGCTGSMMKAGSRLLHAQARR